MSKYLTALKGQNIQEHAQSLLQKLQKAPSCSFCSTPRAWFQKFHASKAAINDPLPEPARHTGQPALGTDAALEPARRQATPAERAELAGLLAAILPNDPEGRREALDHASTDPDGALVSFRALAGDRYPVTGDPFPARPTCATCKRLTTARDGSGFRRCAAAGGVYHPAPDVPRRCFDYLPPADDPDRRRG